MASSLGSTYPLGRHISVRSHVVSFCFCPDLRDNGILFYQAQMAMEYCITVSKICVCSQLAMFAHNILFNALELIILHPLQGKEENEACLRYVTHPLGMQISIISTSFHANSLYHI